MSKTTTDACTDACARILKSNPQWHTFAMWWAAFEVEPWKAGVDEAPRKRAWKKTFKSKFQAAKIIRMKENEDFWESFIAHMRPSQQAVVDLKAAIEERLRGAALVDTGDFFEEGGAQADVDRLARLILRGVENRKVKKPSEADYGQGVVQEYAPNYAAPTARQICNAARSTQALALRPMAELKADGLTKFLKRIKQNRHGEIDVWLWPEGAIAALQKQLGWIEERVTLTIAQEAGAQVVRETLPRLRAALEAMAAGEAGAWCRERFAELAATSPDERWSRLAAEATGEVWEVEAAVLAV